MFESDPSGKALHGGFSASARLRTTGLDPVLEILVEPVTAVDPDLGAAARLVARGLEERSTEFRHSTEGQRRQGSAAAGVRAPAGFFAGAPQDPLRS